MATARGYHTATRLADGRVLVAGGIRGSALDSAELFNPATGTWSPAGPLATARFNHTATRLADGRVLVAGGNDRVAPLTSAEIFNPATETWSPAGPLATGRDEHTATPLADGRVLVTGGIIPTGLLSLASAEVYDPLNFLSNGSFESAGVDPGVGFITLPNGNTTITQWVVASGGIDYTAGAWQAAEGRRSLDLNALSAGSIQQSIATVAGARYLVTFALAGNPAAPAVKTLRVFAAVQSQDFSFDTTGKSTINMGWTGKSWTFTATGATTTLRFQSLTDGANGPALDQVRVIRASSLPFLLPLLLD
jgi:choice-of-anchor C domain-containing protein